MKYFALAICWMLSACNSGSSGNTTAQEDPETEQSNPSVTVPANPPEQDDPDPQITDPPVDARDVVDGRFLVNSVNDFWSCNYSEGQTTYWQAKITFYENGVGDVLFDLQDSPSTIAWSIASTLNIFGPGLGLTTFNVQINANPMSETGELIGQLNADVAQGGHLECMKLLRQNSGI
jgi:hypothetical protein